LNSIIDFKNIYVSYDVTPVLKDINLQINQGEHWAILGSNGSGKSTLIKLLSNDLYPNTKYKFSKKIFGQTTWSIFELKKNLGIITNDLHNYFEKHGNYLTAKEVILSGYYSSIGIFKHQDFTETQYKKADEVLDFLEILEIKDKKVYQMSTGQLRRCVIGRALIHNPKAFILDEPTVGLDIKAQQSFIALIRKLSKNASIIIITHHIEEIFPEVSHIALMYQQTIYKKGKKQEILNSENLSEIFEVNIDIENENDRYYIKTIQ
jgi:iron complex transport system ATP-binding protein